MSQALFAPAGLEGVVVGPTRLSNVEGKIGRLTYYGYDIHDLAPNAHFEEVVYLLHFGELPTRSQLDGLRAKLAEHRDLPPAVVAMMKSLPKDSWPMDVLRTSISMLSQFEPHNHDGAHTSDEDAATKLIAKTPTIVAAWDRVRRGLEPVPPRAEYDAAANFLWMRTGEEPHGVAVKALDMYLVLHCDHSFNASTFAARCTASTRADIYAAVTTAVATLEGNLHGGAPSEVMHMLEGIGTKDKVEPYVREILRRGERVMGIGHREYKVRDPRAQHLEAQAKALGIANGDTHWYDLAVTLEQTAVRVLQEEKPDRSLYANVDFYSAPMLSSLGIPSDEFTCMFACGRMVGWTAHVLEQLAHNRIFRPQAEYTGPTDQRWVPIDLR
ncbi:MAG TPA: citrate/2-methylcitrate synthase [Candidatus Dormibacteraeota bacterium]|nr:citrate/2-methylcitrate synthase [Candidatus Dormibacteraeota bacterium]